MKPPLLSAVIPAFNSASTIARAIESAYSVGCHEVIVVDDGSTDETALIAADRGARVLRQANSGPAAARHLGISSVQSEFVILLDSDDVLLAGMRDAVACIQASEELSVVGGRVRPLRHDKRVSAPGRIRSLPTRFSTHDLLNYEHAPWPPAAAVWRTSALRAADELTVPAIDPEFAEDYELLIRGSLAGGVGMVGEFTLEYSVGGGRSACNAIKEVSDSERVRDHYARATGVSIRLLSASEITDQAAWREFYATGLPRHPARLLRFLLRRATRRLVIR